MHVTNIEFKAKVAAIEPYENKLLTLDPVFKGLDHQIDTYFHVPHGRLKLREGNIENALINYDRADSTDAKESQVILYHHEPNTALKSILTKQLGVKVVVDKKRKIYFIDNVKFHFDVVQHLGTFIEVEAINRGGAFTTEALKAQCDHYFEFFGLSKDSVMAQSYSDMLMGLQQ